MYNYQSYIPNGYSTMPNSMNSSMSKMNKSMPINNQDRIAGGFLGPFILGGITGGLVAPAFYGGYGRPYGYNRPCCPPYGPYYY